MESATFVNCPELVGQSDFANSGFVVLKSFLNREDVTQVHAALQACCNRSTEFSCTRPHNTLLPLRWDDPVIQLILSARHRMRRLEIELGGNDLKWISAYISSKAPHSPALWWHQDWWCWNHPISYRRAPAQAAVLCYLSRMDARNGAIRILPGSHLGSTAIHALLPEAHSHIAEGVGPEHPAMADLPGQLTLCLEAGDAVAIDYRLLHSTHGNKTDYTRDCILLSFTPSWRELPDEVKGHLIQHPCQPLESERAELPGSVRDVLPSYDGPRRSLVLNRNAPADFKVVE